MSRKKCSVAVVVVVNLAVQRDAARTLARP